MLKYCITLMLILFITIGFAGTTGKLAGKVKDAQGKPVAYANVVLDSTQIGTQSKDNGAYVIINIPPGTYNVIVTAIGYQKYTVKGVRITVDATTTVNATLQVKEAVGSASITIDPGISGKSNTLDMATMGRISTSSLGSATAGRQQKISAGENRSEVPNYTVDGMTVSDPIDVQGGYTGRYHSKCMPPPPPPVHHQNYNTEDYAAVVDNPFRSVGYEPLSTFSIDVDTATYSNIRRLLNEKTLPEKSYVRIEELLNYFDYDYPAPIEREPFSVNTEIGTCPWNQKHQLLHIGLKGREIDLNAAPKCNFVFLLDVSGSMQDENKLPLVKQSMKLLVNQLRPEDRVAIVVYASNTGIALESTSGRNRQVIKNAIDELHADGSTAGGAGITLAYEVASEYFIEGGNNRIILCTDGDFNTGESSDAEMQKLIEKKRKQGIFLTVLGYGMGNIKDNKMEILADKGNGNYAYIDNILEANKVLVKEMGGTLFTIAKDVKLQIEFNPAKIKAYRLIGYENRTMNKEDFNDDKKDAGEIGAGHSVTALYELIPANSDESIPDVDALKYQPTQVSAEALASNELLTIKLRYKQPDGVTSILITHPLVDKENDNMKLSQNFQWSAAVAEFGMLLRDSEYKGNSNWNKMIETARSAIGKDEDGYRKEFISMAETARSMMDNHHKPKNTYIRDGQ